MIVLVLIMIKVVPIVLLMLKVTLRNKSAGPLDRGTGAGSQAGPRPGPQAFAESGRQHGVLKLPDKHVTTG